MNFEKLDDCNTTEDIENYRVKKIKELTQARNDRNTIKQEKLLKQKEIIISQGEKKVLENDVRQVLFHHV